MASTAHLIKVSYEMILKTNRSQTGPRNWDWQKVN